MKIYRDKPHHDLYGVLGIDGFSDKGTIKVSYDRLNKAMSAADVDYRKKDIVGYMGELTAILGDVEHWLLDDSNRGVYHSDHYRPSDPNTRTIKAGDKVNIEDFLAGLKLAQEVKAKGKRSRPSDDIKRAKIGENVDYKA